MEISIDLADVKRVFEDLSKAQRRLGRLKERWLSSMNDEEGEMLLLLGHELGNVSQEIERWMEDYWHEAIADRKSWRSG